MRFTPVAVLLIAVAVPARDRPKFAGPTETGFLLPNGWHLTPVGRHAVTTDLPLNILPLKDGKHALVATSGYNRHELLLIDLTGEPKVISSDTVRQSWYGLAVDTAEATVWWSGGGAMRLHTFGLKDGKLAPHEPARPGAEEGDPGGQEGGQGRPGQTVPERPVLRRGSQGPLLVVDQHRRVVGH